MAHRWVGLEFVGSVHIPPQVPLPCIIASHEGKDWHCLEHGREAVEVLLAVGVNTKQRVILRDVPLGLHPTQNQIRGQAHRDLTVYRVW